MAQSTWTGGNADWSVSADWKNGSGIGGQPNQNDSVTINNGATVSIAFGENYPGLLNSYQSLTISGGSTLDVNGALGAVGAVTLDVNSYLTVGTTGVLNLNDGLSAGTGSIFTVNGTTSILGAAFTSSGLTTVGTGVLFNVTNGLTIGTAGSLHMQSGSSLTTYGIVVNGTMDIAAGASAYSSNGLTANGTVTIEGNYTGGNGIYGSGSVTVDGGTMGTALAPMYGQQTASVTISQGGTLYWSGGSGPINFGTASTGQTNTLILSNESNQINTPITNFGTNSVIQFLGSNTSTISGVTVTGTSTTGVYAVAINNNGQQIVTLNSVTFATGITPVEIGSTNTYTVAGLTDQPIIGGSEIYCFLKGSAIATPSGEVAVEMLQPGDVVTTLVGGVQVSKPVKWIGYRSVKPGDLSGDEAHPVRIKAAAFTDNVPSRDLLMTCEHSVFIDGGLIPVRMLVNGRSIISDKSISEFTYYHVELEEHGILLAEGLPVESYLDDGHRSNFANAQVAALHPRFAFTAALPNSAVPVAPLMVAMASVKPVWERLNQRAHELGLASVARTEIFSDDANLHIIMAGGETIRPKQYQAGMAIFELPPNQAGFSLASRTARPCDTMAPYIDDRRALGISVGQMNLRVGTDLISISTHLEQAELSGWHALEGTTHRWTGGLAELPISGTHQAAALLEIQILQAGPYLDTASTTGAMAA